MRAFLLLIGLLFAPFHVTAQWRAIITVENTSNLAGYKLGIRIFDRTTGIEAVSFIEPSITASGGYGANLRGLVQGHDYNIDVYIDTNNSGKYEPPPADLAWRQSFYGVTEDVTTTFDVTASTMDIEFPNIDISELHQVTKTYVGVWENQTFETTGTATANSRIDYKAGTIALSMSASDGAFGIPTPVALTFTGTIDAIGDVAVLTAEPPASGYLRLVRGRVLGFDTLQNPPVVLEIGGNYGENQIMFSYYVSGGTNAYGIMTLTEATATDVHAEPKARLMLYPNPSVSNNVDVTSDLPFDQIEVHSIAGELLMSIACEATMHHNLVLDSLANGVYAVTTRNATSATHAMLIVQ